MRLLPLLLFSLLLPATLAKRWSSSDLPSPQLQPSICGRGKLKSSVCDPDGYISQSDADTIDGLINFIHAGTHGFSQTPCRGGNPGAELTVAVVSSMAGSGDKEARAYKFARDIHDSWGVGDVNCQSGVVLFFAVDDRAVGISVGRGLKGLFKNSMVPAVISVMKAKLRNREYGAAIIDGVVATGNILSGGKPPVVESEGGMGSVFAFLTFLGVFGGGAAYLSRRRRGRYARCRRLLERIDTDRTRASSNEYVATSCPICLEDFDGPGGENSGVQAVPNQNTSVRSTTGSTTTTTTQEQLSTKVLPCGHKFHESCILSWVAGNATGSQLCPICRQPITVAGERILQMTNSGRPSGWDVYDPEYSFRVRRVRHYYSDFVTWNMINSWEADRYNQRHSMATGSLFTAVDPVVVAAAARSSGSGGTSFSFGGGSSAGGGGGGGSW